MALKFAGIPDRHILIKLINRLWLEVGLLCEYFVIATNSYILITAFPFSLFNSSEMYWQKRLWSFFAGRGGGGHADVTPGYPAVTPLTTGRHCFTII